MGSVLFLSHPIGDRDDDPIRWHDNLANAGAWIRFLIETTSFVILCPWYVYAVVHGNGSSAGRRLVDSITAMERCDVVVQAGGVISPHMRDYDAKVARRFGIPLVDLTSFGILPPDRDDKWSVALIGTRINRAVTTQPRRVWMPLLTDDDLARLKQARLALYQQAPRVVGEFDAAIALLDRIISAASARGED